MAELRQPLVGRPIDHLVVAVPVLSEAAQAYGSLGFTLTPRALHPWGTANQLVQFAGHNFIELLEIYRPELIPPHGVEASPRRFSFGRFNGDFLARSQGMAMLVMQGSDSASDLAEFRRAGLETFAPFDFERQARQPDGREVTVAFSLAIVRDPAAEAMGWFTCHNRFPENFWKPPFQHHANGATGIRGVVAVSNDPAGHRDFLLGFSGGSARSIDGCLRVETGGGWIEVLDRSTFEARYPEAGVDLTVLPRFAAAIIEGRGPQRLVPAPAAAGLALILA